MRFKAAVEPAELDHEEEVPEEIVAVGTRVRRTNLDSPSPLIILDASDVQYGCILAGLKGAIQTDGRPHVAVLGT